MIIETLDGAGKIIAEAYLTGNKGNSHNVVADLGSEEKMPRCL